MSRNVQRALRLVMLAAGLLGLFPALTSLGHTQDAILAAGEAQTSPGAQTSPEAQTSPDPVVLRADEMGVVLEWRAPAFSQQQVTGGDGRFYSELEAPGWIESMVPGQPQLPVASVLAVVPPTGEVTLRVQVMEQDRYPLSHPVVPALEPIVVGTAPDATIEWVWARNEQTYATGLGRSDRAAGLYPAEIVTLEEAGWQRGRRLMRLTFFPLRFNPVGSALDVAQRVRVALGFSEENLQAAGGWSSDDPFIPLLQRAVINPDQVTRFARPERPAVRETRASETLQASGPRYKLIVSREGIYELTRDALVAAGVPVTTTAYRLEHAGEEVAYQWESNGDAVFEAGERILFYARPTFTRFADYDVYWLTVGTAGVQMAVRTGDPTGLPTGVAWATTIAEQDGNGQQYLGRYLSEWDSDHWYWDRLYWDYKTGTGERDKDFYVTLPALDAGASNVTLRVHLQGTTSNASINPDHRIQAQLNDGTPDAAEWDGNVYHTATFSPPANLLQAGINTVRLQLPGTGASSGVEEAWLDGIELRYGISTVSGDSVHVEGEAGQKQYTLGGFSSDSARIYDVTSLAAPQIVTPFDVNGGSVNFGDADAGTATYYLLTEDQIAAPDEIVPALTLADPPGGADYLIIAHSDFITAVAPLAAYRAISDGLRVFSTTAQAIYDTHSEGIVTSAAIKDYIAHAYNNWVTPTLSYVL
ncbi:MAG: C25 family cysteine peptidase, partial [Anaerolineae bacterium]